MKKRDDLTVLRRTVKQLTQERQALTSRLKQAELRVEKAEAERELWRARFDRLLARDAEVK